MNLEIQMSFVGELYIINELYSTNFDILNYVISPFNGTSCRKQWGTAKTSQEVVLIAVVVLSYIWTNFHIRILSQLAYVGTHRNLALSAETDQFVYIFHENNPKLTWSEVSAEHINSLCI